MLTRTSFTQLSEPISMIFATSAGQALGGSGLPVLLASVLFFHRVSGRLRRRPAPSLRRCSSCGTNQLPGRT